MPPHNFIASLPKYTLCEVNHLIRCNTKKQEGFTMWISDDGFTHCVILPLFPLDSIENQNQNLLQFP